MIVICEQCQTRFKLDESRIPPGGARVRCSRCKHAFFLPAPGSDEPDLLDELISQTAAEPLRAPPPAEDLQERTPAPEPVEAEPPVERLPGSPSPDRPSGDELRESDWEFTEDVPGPSARDEESAPEIALAGARAPDPVAREPEPELPASTSGAEPGDELDWDFDADAAAAAEGEVGPAGEAPGWPSASSAPVPERQQPAVTPRAPEFLEAPERVGRLLGAAGWIATVVLAAIVTAQLLAPPTPARREPISARPVGPLVAESLRGRFVDNLFVGPLLVVTAELRNPGKSPASLGALLRAVLVDSDGHPLPGSRAALAPAAERELRERPPDALAAQLAERAQSLATEAVAPGGTVGVAAVFPAPAPEAWGLSLEMGPRVSREPPPAQPPLDAGAGPPTPGTAPGPRP